ncbi:MULTISPECIES: DUF2127 domain-containing protein [Ferrimonas]|uniref:DUF2127 domain-containing protein n=1 Tax=Ferrimonas TaxID=44011 RepID=UPI0004207C61|nr:MULTISPECIES: DUF2127 domain-containing protein [Ferrimonas]USD36627.1 DUF2127 domain-containing protein [Ferrimonas sp. SCSIO 43195]
MLLPRFLALCTGLYAGIGLAITVAGTASLAPALVYATLYGGLPLLAAIGLWRQQRWAMIMALLLFASQIIRPLGAGLGLAYSPPISLGIPIWSTTLARGWLLDLLALLLTLALGWLLRRSAPQPAP